MGKIIEVTESICPECKKELKADIVEESGSIFMQKQCSEHGFFKSLISKYAWYYKGLNSFYNALFPKGHTMGNKTVKILQFYPTYRCNMHCHICFSDSDADSKKGQDPSIDDIKKMIKSIRGKKKIGILGGEPTVRDDLPDIIRLFSQAGHQVHLYTNGLKLVDPAYAQKLKDSGVKYVWTWIDTMQNEYIYKKIRGAELCVKKKQALNNLNTLKIKTVIINVIARGVNQSEIPHVIDFAKGNHFITTISIRGYSHIGKRKFSLSEEFVMDELIDMVEKQTEGLVTLEEFFIFQKITYVMRSLLPNQPQCYVCQYLYLPRKNQKRIRDIFPPKSFNKILDDFVEIYKKSPVRAKIFFMYKMLAKIITNPCFFASIAYSKLMRKSNGNNCYLLLEIAMFYTPYTLDLKQVKTRCTDAWLPAYAKGNILDFCSMLSKGRE
jgi:uncharacterized radical SAM superfamily Fe-S cluster-containing enzyme